MPRRAAAGVLAVGLVACGKFEGPVLEPSMELAPAPEPVVEPSSVDVAPEVPPWTPSATIPELSAPPWPPLRKPPDGLDMEKFSRQIAAAAVMTCELEGAAAYARGYLEFRGSGDAHPREGHPVEVVDGLMTLVPRQMQDGNEATVTVEGFRPVDIRWNRDGERPWKCEGGPLQLERDDTRAYGYVANSPTDDCARPQVTGCGSFTYVRRDGSFAIQLPEEPCTLRAFVHVESGARWSPPVSVQPIPGEAIRVDLELPPPLEEERDGRAVDPKMLEICGPRE